VFRTIEEGAEEGREEGVDAGVIARGRMNRAVSTSRLVSPETNTSLYEWRKEGREGGREDGRVNNEPVQCLAHVPYSLPRRLDDAFNPSLGD